MEDCLLLEMEAARERGEDLTPYLVRMEGCRWEHDVTTCEVCRSDGLLPAQECVVLAYSAGNRD
jgi:hypothetical protein